MVQSDSLFTKAVSTASMFAALCFPGREEFDSSLKDQRSATVSVQVGILKSVNQQLDFDQRLKRTVGYRELTESEQAQVLKLFNQFSHEQKRNFIFVAERTQGDNPKAILLHKDSKGNSLLDNIDKLTTCEFHSDLTELRADLITSLLQETGLPGQLNQASWGVCATGGIYGLFRDDPAEAVRLFTGLVSKSGAVEMPGGYKLVRAKYSMLPDARPGRTHSERIFMSALMELGNGSDYNYCNVCDENYHIHTGKTYRGLTDPNIATLQRALWNKSVAYMSIPGNSNDTLYSKLKQLGTGLHPVSLKWSLSEVKQPGGVKRHLLPHESPSADTKEAHHKVLRQGSDRREMKQTYHMVLITQIKDGRVHYRNLHGPTGRANGTELSNPPRRVEDNQNGFESMAEDEFKKRLRVVYYPRSN